MICLLLEYVFVWWYPSWGWFKGKPKENQPFFEGPRLKTYLAPCLPPAVPGHHRAELAAFVRPTQAGPPALRGRGRKFAKSGVSFFFKVPPFEWLKNKIERNLCQDYSFLEPPSFGAFFKWNSKGLCASNRLQPSDCTDFLGTEVLQLLREKPSFAGTCQPKPLSPL